MMKYLGYIFSSLCILFIYQNCTGQRLNNKGIITIKLNLRRIQYGDVYVLSGSPRELRSPNDYQNIPDSSFPHFSLRYFAFDKDQNVYDSYLKGTLTKKVWENYYNFSNGPKLRLYHEPIANNRIGIFTGIDDNGQKTIIIDANNNHDFSDDKRYVVPKEQQDTASFHVKLKGAAYIGNKVIDTTFNMIMLANQRIIYDNDSLQNKLGVSFLNDAAYTGQLKINGTSNRFTIAKPLVRNARYSDVIIIRHQLIDKTGSILAEKSYLEKDTIKVGGKLYRLRLIDLDKQFIQLEPVQKDAKAIISVGDSWPVLRNSDLVTDKPIQENFKGKYLLVDFWGSWCVPCRKGIPDLVKAHNFYLGKLDILSIAYDAPEALPEVKNIIKNQQMNWMNIWDDHRSGDLVKQFQVNSFPTYFLVDPRGKIIYKGESIYSLKDLLKRIK